MISGSPPIFALSNQTTFSQTETGATVPLIRGRLQQNTQVHI
jgi:hypothetical protein